MDAVVAKFSQLQSSRSRPIIQVDAVNKTYSANGQTLTVFDKLSIDVEKGSFLTIIGPSGCGKSTLLRLISGLDTPTSGKLFFQDREVSGPPKGMIYVFQQYGKSIFPWRTVIQNIEFGLSSSTGHRRREARDRCLEYVRLVGLEGYADYYPFQLSGGMQQRVCIARALVCEPEVLLMDEPFSAVDAMTRAIMQELILEIWGKLKLTMLFVTHDVGEAVFLSTRILSLGAAPLGVKEDIPIDLPHPRDAVKTRDDPRFVALSQKLFSTILTEEKRVDLNAINKAADKAKC